MATKKSKIVNTDSEDVKSIKEHIDSKIPVAPQPPVFGITEEIDEVVIPEEEAESLVRFHTTNISTPIREFSEDVHGENWREVANEFHKNNTHQIRSREDL